MTPAIRLLQAHVLHGNDGHHPPKTRVGEALAFASFSLALGMLLKAPNQELTGRSAGEQPQTPPQDRSAACELTAWCTAGASARVSLGAEHRRDPFTDSRKRRPGAAFRSVTREAGQAWGLENLHSPCDLELLVLQVGIQLMNRCLRA